MLYVPNPLHFHSKIMRCWAESLATGTLTERDVAQVISALLYAIEEDRTAGLAAFVRTWREVPIRDPSMSELADADDFAAIVQAAYAGTVPE